jgi:hypothetical protein
MDKANFISVWRTFFRTEILLNQVNCIEGTRGTMIMVTAHDSVPVEVDVTQYPTWVPPGGGGT